VELILIVGMKCLQILMKMLKRMNNRMYKCNNCETVYEEEPEDNICSVCFEQSVYKDREGRIN
jgi:rRNA maturation endonuclease Nob1